MAKRFSRRDFLGTAVAGIAGFGISAGGAQGLFKTRDLIQQHETWAEAGRPNADFLNRHAPDVARLTLGASFAPEQWRRDPTSQQEALAAFTTAHRELGMTKLRLGLRWDRTERPDGSISLRTYQPFLDYAMANNLDLALNIGPVRVFRWPEDHVPSYVLQNLDHAPKNHETLSAGSPLAQRGIAYVHKLSTALQETYGADLARVSTVQIENEPFYPMGDHDWKMDQGYMRTLAAVVNEAWPGRRLLVTSAGRLNLHAIRDLYRSLLHEDPSWKGRLVSGFDFHYRTPKRDHAPLLRYFDQIDYAYPFAATPEGHISDSRSIGFEIEVAEGQMEPYQYLTTPGNRVADLRFLILRCLEKVLDPKKPALIRVWGIEEFTKKMLHGEMTSEHREMVSLFQAVNSTAEAPAKDAIRPQ